MAWGLRGAGFAPAWGVDWSQDACATYRSMIGSHSICSRVEEVDFAELEPVNGLAFGFPCNDFSMVGEKKGKEGYFGGLYLEAKRALDELKPDWFIAENVPGIMSSGGTSIMEAFANSGRGYRLAVHLFRFEDYGVPQKRRRVIGVGIRSDWDLTFLPPVPSHPRPVTAQEALAGVEQVAANGERPRHSAKVIELLSHIPPGENCWHSSVPDRLKLNVPNVRMSLIYRRLHPDEPAYTVVGSGGGGTHTYHWAEPRALTNRERARLQSFPDDFVFVGTAQSVRRQIGMAVPPLGARAIGEALMKTLRRESYPSVVPSVGVLTENSAHLSLVRAV
jgi:DNA (cytosine-5)-methyltransferase 1